MTVCLQCSMEAMLKGERYTPVEESPEEHTKRAHPDPVQAWHRRQELERLLKVKFWKADHDGFIE